MTLTIYPWKFTNKVLQLKDAPCFRAVHDERVERSYLHHWTDDAALIGRKTWWAEHGPCLYTSREGGQPILFSTVPQSWTRSCLSGSVRRISLHRSNEGRKSDVGALFSNTIQCGILRGTTRNLHNSWTQHKLPSVLFRCSFFAGIIGPSNEGGNKSWIQIKSMQNNS